MITQDEIERAVDWLRDNAIPAAKARATRIYLESYVKVVLAEEMRLHSDIAIGAQDREARCSRRYAQTLEALRDAVEDDERHRFLRDAAQAKIEAWRSLEATKRAEGKAYS